MKEDGCMKGSGEERAPASKRNTDRYFQERMYNGCRAGLHSIKIYSKSWDIHFA